MNAAANDDQKNSGDVATGAKCAICRAQATQKYAPFCSKRCADVDLHRWLNGSYAIPTQEDESDGAPFEPDEA